MITITARLILMALLCWWLAKEHKFKQAEQPLEQGGASFMSSVEAVHTYGYVHQNNMTNS
ncbi:MAG: hypothetical protein QNJ46_05595 [Leptolyngbyaceae cyanobacterium MO_188.B28]|nr:hypothetical protein [Leptolyngbyaceae cyanobacterium MO_188.B28]